MQFVCFENGKRMSAIKKKILNEALVAYRFGKKMEKKKGWLNLSDLLRG